MLVVVTGGCAAAPTPPDTALSPAVGVPAALGTPGQPGTPGHCSEIDVVFARGTNQPPGFGRVGDAFFDALLPRLPGRTVSRYAVNYPADSQQVFGIGTNDVIQHVTQVGTSCPQTRFVLGGYSQGASVVSAAIGVPTPGMVTDALPAWSGSRVAAVVVFGSPLGAGGRSIDSVPSPFRGQSAEFCTMGDTVCGGRGPFPGTHHSYPTSGATEQAARFATQRLSP
ncbi:MAG: cutinase family protein [Pseudonocardia sp.]|nr:cutinase family protein [Pseudonocardia sp.]